MKKIIILLVLAGAWLSTLSVAEASTTHIRVVLDTSQSMRGYRGLPPQDPGKLSILATMLLCDLTEELINVSKGNSFAVIPFDHNYGDWNQGDKRPESNATEIRLERKVNAKQAFIQRIQSLNRNGKKTYFSPALFRAIKELNQQQNILDDARVIVLITDGLPDSAEDEKLYKEIADKLGEGNIVLYVLAFGSSINQQLNTQRRTILDDFKYDSKGNQVAYVSYIGTAGKLMESMLKMFAEEFGYDVQGPFVGPRKVQIRQSAKNEAAAVVAFAGVPSVPMFSLSSSTGGLSKLEETRKNSIVGESSLGEGGAYSLSWIANLVKGAYNYNSLTSKVALADISFAVLIPRHFVINVEDPVNPSIRYDRVVAGDSTLPLTVESPTGSNAPGQEVQLVFKALAEKDLVSGEFVWTQQQIRGSARRKNSVGKKAVFEADVRFDTHPETPAKKYLGYLEAAAQKGKYKIGELAGDYAHPLWVYPPLKVYSPQMRFNQVLEEGGGEQCETFELDKVSGYFLDEILQDPLVVSLIADPPRALDAIPELNMARFTLNGRTLGAGANPKVIFHPKSLEEILKGPGESGYRFCVTPGYPRATGQLNLKLIFTLSHSPYDRPRGKYGQIETIDPVAAVLDFQETSWAWWKACLLLLIPALLWYLRAVPGIEPDLRYHLYRKEEAGAAGPLYEFGPGSFWRKVLHVKGEREITTQEDGRVVAAIVPQGGELYAIRIVQGKLVSEGIAENRKGHYLLEVNRSYEYEMNGKIYLLQIVYA